MHQPSGGIGGTASDIRIQAEQMLYIKRTLAERTAFHTGQSVEQIEKDADRDRWFTAEQAKEYGFRGPRDPQRRRSPDHRAGVMNRHAGPSGHGLPDMERRSRK